MNELALTTLCGLHNQLYEVVALNNREDYYDINSAFWNEILSEESFCNVMVHAKENRFHPSLQSPQCQAAISAPDLFHKHFVTAKHLLLDVNCGEKKSFAAIETLAIFCKLYSNLVSNPFAITIQDGFLRSNASAKEMYDNCLLHHSNPYLDFIKRRVLPYITQNAPHLVWLRGRPNVASFAIARLVKQLFPDIHISIVYHSSEYYSLSKLGKRLAENEPFFEAFNSVVLYDTAKTMQSLRTCISEKRFPSNIPGLIVRHIDKVYQNPLTIESPPTAAPTLDVPFGMIANVKLFVNNQCYWHKCTFCGINQKYAQSGKKTHWDISSAVSQLQAMRAQNVSAFWAIDEAIPPDVLHNLSVAMLDGNLRFVWQARSRIEPALLSPDICDSLSASGLKELRLGLESACPRILTLMNKTEDPKCFLETAERIVDTYCSKGVSIHFPIILGFPSETQMERRQTLNFLSRLRQRYPLFTYNLNILGLDISSDLFNNWPKYGIREIKYPCAPQYFIANLVEWEDGLVVRGKSELLEDQANGMLAQYPWYPRQALTPPHIFYRLMENSRRTLLKKCSITEKENLPNKDYSVESGMKLSENCVLFSTGDELYCAYNFENHHYLEMNKPTFDLLEKLSSQSDVEESQKIPMEMLVTQQQNLLNFLIHNQFLIKERRVAENGKLK